MPSKAERPKVPKFNTEAEEADWWDAHMDMVGEELVKAMKDGTAQRGVAQRLVREAREEKEKRAGAAREAARTLICSVSDQDRNRLHELAGKSGLDDETYVQQLLLDALASAEKAAA